MPLPLPGALTILLAQAGTTGGATTVPMVAPRPCPAAIVQRENEFVIVATDTIAKPAVVAPLAIGRAVRIDRVLIATAASRNGSAPR